MTLQLKTKAWEDLRDILRWGRPAGSALEQRFCEAVIEPTGATADAFGNYWLDVLTPEDEHSPVMWSCHTDTVHSKPIKAAVQYDGRYLELHPNSSASCLGADCGTGIWIMLEMIKAQVPGLYIFHRAEEVGCQGSRWIRDHAAASLEGIKFAIAFDRKGNDSIITHQASGRTCSEKFARSLMPFLPGYKLDPTGMYTDTDTYADLIPECTNLSVGYEMAHSSAERQDVLHASRLLDYVKQIDQSKLIVDRDPTVAAFDRYGWSTWDEPTDLEGWVRANPGAAAAILEDIGFDFRECTRLWGPCS